MPTFQTANTSIQHFPDGYDTINFTRPINSLFITTTGAKQISFDGVIYMNLETNKFHSFYNLHQAQIKLLGAGSAGGMGMSL